jgi:hypothetical protein
MKSSLCGLRKVDTKPELYSGDMKAMHARRS